MRLKTAGIFILIILFGGSFSVKKNPVDPTVSTIHVLVALCDNKYQGIVPVPAKIGNGQDPNNNLYWGCGFGIRSYFKKSAEWKLIKTEKIDSVKFERLIFKHTSKIFTWWQMRTMEKI